MNACFLLFALCSNAQPRLACSVLHCPPPYFHCFPTSHLHLCTSVQQCYIAVSSRRQLKNWRSFEESTLSLSPSSTTAPSAFFFFFFFSLSFLPSSFEWQTVCSTFASIRCGGLLPLFLLLLHLLLPSFALSPPTLYCGKASKQAHKHTHVSFHWTLNALSLHLSATLSVGLQREHTDRPFADSQ